MSIRGWWALLLAAGLVVGNAVAADEAPAADPAWGPYATLAGRSASAGTDGYTLRWYWIEPGQELAQEYINPSDGSLDHRDVITIGETPGTLVLQSSYMGRKQWHGTLQPDGHVLFIGKGLLKLPYLAGVGENGAWEIRQVELDDGRIASVDEASRYNSFAFADAAPAAVAEDAAAAPPTASPAAPAAIAETLALAPVAPVTAETAATAASTATAGTPQATSMLGSLAKSLGLGGEDAADSPPPVINPDFGVMSEFVGRQFVYRDTLGSVSLADGGQQLVLQFGSHVYHLQATERPDRYEVVSNSHGLSPKAKRLPDGAIEVSFSTRSVDDMIGTRHRIKFDKGDQGGIKLFAEYHPIAAFLAGWDYSWAADYRPYSDTAAAEERTYAQWDREDNAERARQRAIEQAEMDAAWQRGMANMAGNLSDYAAREQQRMDESQAVLDEINAMARAEAEAQRYAEQQAAQQYAAQQQAAQQQLAQQQQAARQQALAQQQAAMRDRQSQLQAQPAQSAGGTGSWEHAGGNPSSASAGTASTRDDAGTCISPPVTSRHKCASLTGYKGLVSNSCTVPVDVRMCFMTATGWNCQSNYGLAPQETWEPGWCHANTGEVFHSVRYSDDREPLASP